MATPYGVLTDSPDTPFTPFQVVVSPLADWYYKNANNLLYNFVDQYPIQDFYYDWAGYIPPPADPVGGAVPTTGQIWPRH